MAEWPGGGESLQRRLRPELGRRQRSQAGGTEKGAGDEGRLPAQGPLSLRRVGVRGASALDPLSPFPGWFSFLALLGPQNQGGTAGRRPGRLPQEASSLLFHDLGRMENPPSFKQSQAG